MPATPDPSSGQLVLPEKREKAAFWDDFPTDADDFSVLVGVGITYSYTLRLPSLRQPRQRYRGFSHVAVGRDRVFWLADPEGFAREHDDVVLRAIEDYTGDKERALIEWRREYDEALRKFESDRRVPTEIAVRTSGTSRGHVV